MVGARDRVVFMQPVRRERWHRSSRCAEQEPGLSGAVSTRACYPSLALRCSILTLPHLVLQPLGEPRAVCQALTRSVCEDGEEDGGHADFFGVDVDRGGFSVQMALLF